MRCVDIPGLHSQPTVAAYGDSQATTYKRHSHQGKLLTCIPPRTVRKASSWLSALCINTINPPAKNAGHHQAFLTSLSFYLSLQILLFILPLSLFSLSLSSFISLSFALYPFWIYSKMFNYLITWWTLAECKSGRIVLMTNQAFSVFSQHFSGWARWDGILGERGRMH